MNRTRRRHTALGLTMLIASCGSSTCATETSTQAARSALDAFDVAGSASWAVVNQGCITQQRAIEAQAKARTITTDEARTQLAPVRARCSQLTALFQEMRLAHDQAADLVNQGKVDEAQAWLAKLRERWHTATELPADPAVEPLQRSDPVADAGAPIVVPGFGGAL